jgi:F0F1-type ATP synthase membrane subunit b/b'
MNITWAIFILYLKKVGLFFKNYGVVILLGAALVYVLIFAKKKQDSYNLLLKQLQDQIEKHHEEVEALEKEHEESLKRYAEIEKRYNETLQRIEQQYQDALSQLDKQKKQELHQIIAETHDNPDEMARRVNNLFGLPIYQTPTQ